LVARRIEGSSAIASLSFGVHGMNRPEMSSGGKFYG
jgi:hypothetical protein